MHLMTKVACTIVLLCASVLSKAAGFHFIESDELTMGIWYPSKVQEEQHRLGPFDVTYALNGKISEGKYQPVLLSHGNSGRWRNHHLTAKALADSGYIVIAVQHSADHLIGGGNTAGAMALRIEQLRQALNIVRMDSVFSEKLDLSRVHGLGYSLGGATVLAAAGAEINLESAESHCATYPGEDAAFCESPPILWRLYQRLRNPVSIRKKPDQFHVEPFINGLTAVIAPIGQGLEIAPERFDALKVLVIEIEGDLIAQPRFHAKNIVAILPAKKLADSLSVPGHHYAFIAPFADRVKSKENIPVAVDPEGFDRRSFIKRVNSFIVKFFKQSNNEN